MKKFHPPLRAGFTMVEVAMAILVVAVGLLGVFALFPVGLHAGRDAIDDSEIMMVAESVLNGLQTHMATNYSDRATGFVYDFNGTPIRANQGRAQLFREDGFTPICTAMLKVRAVPSARGSGLAEATVTCWPGNNSRRTMEFYTRCAKRK